MLRRLTRDRYLTDAELARFMAAVRERRHKHQPRDLALFALLANTGIRPSEALALTRADLALEGPEPWIRVSRLKKRPGAPRVDELALTPRLAAVLSAHIGQLEAGASRVFPVSIRQAQRLFHAYSARAGIRGRHWLYALRHTAATRIYRATRDIDLVQSLLGHERPDMSCLYAHVPRSVQADTLDKLPAVV